MTLILSLKISVIYIANVQAATTDDTIKVHLDNLIDIMNENNLEIKTYCNNKEIAKEQYEMAKDEVNTAQENVDTKQKIVNNFKPLEDGSNLNDLVTYKKNLSAAKESLKVKKSNLSNLRYTLKIAKIQYLQNVATEVNKAGKEYIDYLIALSDEELEEETVKSQEKSLQISKLQYENGFISNDEYITTIQNNTDAINKLQESKDNEALAKTNLYIMLGLSNADKIKISTDFNEDLNKIAKINYDDDLAKMLDNNVEIQLQNIAIDKLKDEIDAETTTNYYTDEIDNYNTDNAQITLQQKINSASVNFKAQYNTLISSYHSIKSNYDKIVQTQKDYETTKIKYDYGFVSLKNVYDAKLELNAKMSSFSKDKNTLYVNYLRYIQMKEGY